MLSGTYLNTSASHTQHHCKNLRSCTTCRLTTKIPTKTSLVYFHCCPNPELLFKNTLDTSPVGQKHYPLSREGGKNLRWGYLAGHSQQGDAIPDIAKQYTARITHQFSICCQTIIALMQGWAIFKVCRLDRPRAAHSHTRPSNIWAALIEY